MRLCIVILVFLPACVWAQVPQARTITVHFETGSHLLPPAEQHRLDSLATELKKWNVTYLRMDAYCDARGQVDYNKQLAARRAAAVEKILRPSVTDTLRMQTHVLGENDSLASNGSDAGMQQNRSVVIRWRGPRKTSAATRPAKDRLLSDSLVAGSTIVLNTINFVGGMDVLLPQSHAALDELLQVMKKKPTLKIEIRGHVCCFDDMDLSVARARRICNILIRQGIAPDRLSFKGYSNRVPVASEETEAGRMRNRRVEIHVVSL